MTALLEEEYKWLKLKSCMMEDIDRGLVKNAKTTLITFKEFYDNSK